MAGNTNHNIVLGCAGVSALGLFGCVGVLGVIIAFGDAPKRPPAPVVVAPAATPTPKKVALTEVVPILQRVAKVFPTKLTEKPCDDASWPQGARTTEIPVVSVSHLQRMAGLLDPVPEGALPKDLGGLNGRTFDGVMEPVSVLIQKPEDEWPMRMTFVPGALRKLTEPGQRMAVIATEKVSHAGYLGWDFLGGSYTGWAVIVDVGSGKPVCQARFTATSSAEVKKGFFENSMNDAVKRDFNDRVSAAAHDALYELSEKSEFDLGLPPKKTDS